MLADTDKRALLRPLRPCRASAARRPAASIPIVFTGFEDILGGLGDIFGFGEMFGGGRRRGGPQRGADLRYDLEIAFERVGEGHRDVRSRFRATRPARRATAPARRRAPSRRRARSATARGQLRYQQGFFTVARTCGQCRGTRQGDQPSRARRAAATARVEQQRKLTVKIPAGIATGQRLRLTGEGEAGSRRRPAGDLYVVIHVQEHAFFHRDGNDLHCEIPLQLHDARARRRDHGARRIDGDEPFKVPEGTQTGATFRLRGKGMPDVSGRGHGDLLVTVKVVTPKKLTKEQRKLLEQLAATLPKEKFEPARRDDEEDDRGLFDRVKDIFG